MNLIEGAGLKFAIFSNNFLEETKSIRIDTALCDWNSSIIEVEVVFYLALQQDFWF